MKTLPVVIERTLNAPVDRVWEALTKLEQMKQWYFDMPAFKPELGFEFQFEGQNKGMIFHHRCQITEIILGKKIQFSWRYEGYEGKSIVTIELFSEGEKTRLKLTHEGIETFPDMPDFARNNFETGWTSIIGTSLPRFLETMAG